MTGTETRQNPRRERGAAWAIAASIAVHVIGLAALVRATAAPPPLAPPGQKPVVAKLVRLGTPRDPKLLPQKETQAPPPPAVARPTPAPGAEPAPDAPPPKPSTAPGPPIAPKAPGPASTTETSAEAKSRLFDAFARVGQKPSSSRAPVGSPTGHPDGDSDEASEGEQYFGLILAKARRNFGVTKTISPAELKSLKAVVVLFLGSRGELIRPPELQESSGNALFDQDVLLAVQKAAPYGPPPPHLARDLRTVGVAFKATP